MRVSSAKLNEHISRINTLLILILVFLLFYFPFNIAVAQTRTLQGSAFVIDGDTIIVENLKIRLNGLAAPELDETGGQDAKQAMQILLKNQMVRCSLSGKKSYQRYIGTCWIGARDIAALLIMKGKARDCPRYSERRYSVLETSESKNLILPEYCS